MQEKEQQAGSKPGQPAHTGPDLTTMPIFVYFNVTFEHIMALNDITLILT